MHGSCPPTISDPSTEKNRVIPPTNEAGTPTVQIATVPRTLGQYELHSVLGRGAMGTVYEAWHPAMARGVAIKVIDLPPGGEAQDWLARFRREVQAASRLSHPNIVAVHHYDEPAGIPYIVMEFVDGGTLKSRLDARRPMALPDILGVMGDVLAALQHSHDHGVIHRDIKPANILMTAGGRAKVADFGIARIEHGDPTQSGIVMGTPAYMSPEQIRGEVADARTDVYSAGVVLYQLLTHRRPFEGDASSIMYQVLNTRPPRPSELSAAAPPCFDAVVERAMARQPQDRYASAAEFAKALHTKAPPRRVPAWAYGAVLATILAGAGAWFFLNGKSGPPADYYLRLAGSNTIGSRLGPELVKAWLSSKHATDVREEDRPDGDKAVPEHVIDATPNGKAIRVDVRAHGSSTAFTGLAAGTADIGVASRAINDAEAAELTRIGDMRSPASEHVLGLDGVAVIVPSSNAVAKLSTADLRRIFSGEAKTWSEFGGADRPIRLYVRDDNSGTFETFKELALKGAPLGNAKRFEDSSELEEAVDRDPDGIGFVGLPSLKTTRAVPISDGVAAAVEPTLFSTATEGYVLSRRLYLYTAAAPSTPAVKDFVTFVLSPTGQDVVRGAGFVDLDLHANVHVTHPAQPSPCRLSSRWPGDPQAYCRLRDGAEQLSTSFRFRMGSAELDSRATQDLRGVLHRMEQSPDKTIVLAGFADNSGAHANNCALSDARARSIASALGTLGLRATEMVGFCDELPVRDNDTLDGREKNRRVDIFLR